MPHQCLDRAREFAAQRTQRAARGAVGGCFDQVGHALGLGQVELVIEKRAAGEFPRLGPARAQLQAALEQHLHYHRTAMTLQLDHFFAGVGMRGGEIKRESVVYGGAARIEEGRPDGTACRGHFAEKRPRERHETLA